MASGSSDGSLGLSKCSVLLWPEVPSGPSSEVTPSGSFSSDIT